MPLGCAVMEKWALCWIIDVCTLDVLGNFVLLCVRKMIASLFFRFTENEGGMARVTMKNLDPYTSRHLTNRMLIPYSQWSRKDSVAEL